MNGISDFYGFAGVFIEKSSENWIIGKLHLCYTQEKDGKFLCKISIKKIKKIKNFD
jgi:hypothetical protein